jgi:hypothetical protein
MRAHHPHRRNCLPSKRQGTADLIAGLPVPAGTFPRAPGNHQSPRGQRPAFAARTFLDDYVAVA